MIDITPMEEFYLHELSAGKTTTQIAEENNMSRNTVTITINRLKHRTNLNKYDLIQIFQSKEYQIKYRGKAVKGYYEIMAEPHEIVKYRKNGYNTKEIIKKQYEKIKGTIELTPKESIYFKKMLEYKTNKVIAEELGITSAAISMTMKKVYDRTGLDKVELIQAYKKGEVQLTDTNRKSTIRTYYKKQDRSEQIRLMKKLGFSMKEILMELKDE